MLRPTLYLQEGRLSDALASYEENLVNYPNSSIARSALYAKFVNALYRQRDLSAAQSQCDNLANNYSGTFEARLAELEIGNARGSNSISMGTIPILQSALIGADKPTEYSLSESFPNPFNPTTQIRFDLSEDSKVSLVIYDILSRQVAELANANYEAGYHSVTWDASPFASGVYLARFVARQIEGGQATDAIGAVKLSTTQKLVLTK